MVLIVFFLISDPETMTSNFGKTKGATTLARKCLGLYCICTGKCLPLRLAYRSYNEKGFNHARGDSTSFEGCVIEEENSSD